MGSCAGELVDPCLVFMVMVMQLLCYREFKEKVFFKRNHNYNNVDMNRVL